MKTNKSTLIGMLALGLTLPLVMATSHAAGVPSSKVTFQTSGLILIPETTGTSDWETVLSGIIKTPTTRTCSSAVPWKLGCSPKRR